MALVSNPHSAYSPRLPWLGGIAGLLAGGAILYFLPQWNRTWLSLVPAPVSVYTRFLGVTLEDVPLVTYCHQALLGFLMVLLAPGYGKSTLAAWMMHNPASSRRWPGEVFRAWVTKFGLLVMVFCNLFFLSRVPSGTLALYIFILQHVSVAAAVASGVLLLRAARRLARTFDAQLADLRLLMILTLGFQTILPAQIALMSARGVNTPLGWYIVIAQMAGVLLAFMLVGGLVGFSMIGIEWSKLQWLVAALGVGLGFGLQEIFANFISGLIILFEKPIRIGDTVTIRDLTGSVTRINTRATTISDWDRKEIIVPNKAFITEQFINWSLSDSVTRVVLTVPAPVDADTEEVTKILIAAAHRCSLVIDTPAPEAFLVDLQQGIQIFELRIFAAEMGHRMPLRHEMHQLILAGFREHGIDMPFPPFQMRLESIDGRQSSKTMTSAGKTSRRTAGSL